MDGGVWGGCKIRRDLGFHERRGMKSPDYMVMVIRLGSKLCADTADSEFFWAEIVEWLCGECTAERASHRLFGYNSNSIRKEEGFRQKNRMCIYAVQMRQGNQDEWWIVNCPNPNSPSNIRECEIGSDMENIREWKIGSCMENLLRTVMPATFCFSYYNSFYTLVKWVVFAANSSTNFLAYEIYVEWIKICIGTDIFLMNI